jgi:ribonuclease G
VVRQLRLRDIGGIIVIDFIDMSNPKNRETVEDALRAELERDRTKTYVVEISPLGLVEMTRQNVTDGPREILTHRCHVCEGDGVVVSEATHALEVERKLRAVAKGSRVQAFEVAIHPRVLALLAGPGGSRLAALDAAARRRFFLVPAVENGHVHLDHFEILRQGKLETLRPKAPVEDGATIDLKLVEVGLHDPSAGVGKLAGDFQVVVSGAAKLVGKKVTVTVGRVLDGVGFATLADGAVPADAPITFEGEAEKPMRASRAKAKPDVSPVEPRTEEEAVDVVAEVVADEQSDGDGAAAEQPKKKRTRRGSRGGRGRKKPAAAASASEETSTATSEVEENGRPAAPRIHVPPPDLADVAEQEPAAEPAVETQAVADDVTDGGDEPAAAQKRKRSRRGSRGGRKRRKPSTNGSEESDASSVEEPAAETVVATEVPEYVPMSEWIDDFETRSRSK